MSTLTRQQGENLNPNENHAGPRRLAAKTVVRVKASALTLSDEILVLYQNQSQLNFVTSVMCEADEE